MTRVVLYQYAPQERTPEENIAYIISKVGSIKNALIVLPEFGLSSYEDYNFIKSENLRTFMEPLLDICAKQNIAFVTSLPIVHNKKCYNRGLYISKYIFTYKDKANLFGQENEIMHSGVNNPLFTYKKNRFTLQVCLDIINPIQSYEAVLNGANFILNPASVSVDYLRSINKARSLENGVPVIFCNRSGTEKSGTQYLGRSGVFFPDGTEKTITSQEGLLSLLI